MHWYGLRYWRIARVRQRVRETVEAALGRHVCAVSPPSGTLLIGEVKGLIDRVEFVQGNMKLVATIPVQEAGRVGDSVRVTGTDGSLILVRSEVEYFGLKTPGSTWEVMYAIDMGRLRWLKRSDTGPLTG